MKDIVVMAVVMIVAYLAVAILTGIAWLAVAAMLLVVLAKTAQVALRERRKKQL